MRSSKWARIVLPLLVLLGGCKGFWPDATTGGGGTGGGGTGGGTSGASSGVFYVLNQKTSQIAGFTFPSGSKTPAPINGSPYTLSAVPVTMAVSPNGSLLFISTASGIYLFTVGSGGVLTLGNSGQAISKETPTGMVIDPTSSWLIETLSGTGRLNAIPVSPTTGLYNSTIGEQFLDLPTLNVQQIAVSPATAATPYVFVAMGSGGTAVIPFSASASPSPFGIPAAIPVANASAAANAVAVDPSNQLLYVGEAGAITGAQTAGLRVFTIGVPAFTEISGSPFAAGGNSPSAILATVDHVYIANSSVSNGAVGSITGFSVSSTAGAFSLAVISTIAAGTSTVGIAEESTDTYVLAVNSGGSPDLSMYLFDVTTPGKLDAAGTASTGTDPVQALAIVALP